MNDDLNKVLDSCLAELLGAKHPPDLSARILGQLESRQLEPRPLGADALLPPACEPSPTIRVESPATRGSGVGPSPALDARIRPTRARQTRARQDRPVLVVALTTLALGLLVLITTFGVLWRRDRARIDVVERPTTGPLDVVETPETPSPATAPLSSGPPAIAGSPANSSPPDSLPAPVGPPAGSPPAGSAAAVAGNGMKPAPTVVVAPSESGVPSSVARPESQRAESQRAESQLVADPLPESWPEDQIVAFVNRSVREEWTRFSATPPQPIGADAWRERVFLTLLGRTPRADESSVPVANAAARAELVQRLMQADEYVEEFARRWSQLLAESYLPAEVATAANSFSREGMLHYFRRALVEGRSWERVTKELLTAVGSGIPGAADYDGASNFLLSRAGGKFELATADTARLFLGRDVSCVACHDDLERGSRQQREFWELNSFFRQLAVERDPASQRDRLRDVDFHGEDRRDAENAVVFFETPAGLLKSAYPVWPGRSELPKSGIVAEVNRREWLARCVTTSADFRTATVNRFWELVFGDGVVPAAELDLGRAESRRWLATVGEQWAGRDLDPRKLLAWMLVSEPFLAPPADASGLALATAPLTRFRGHSPAAQPDFRRSWLAVTTGESAIAGPAAARVGQNPAASAAAAGIAELPQFGVGATLPPVLKRVVANEKLTSRQKAEHLFTAALRRPPRRAEWELIEPLLAQPGNSPETTWERVWASLQQRVPAAPVNP